MKTKFSAIAKVRKQQLDNAELRLSEAKQRQREHKNSMNFLMHSLEI